VAWNAIRKNCCLLFFGGCPVHNAITAHAGLLPHGLDDMALAHAAPSHQHQIGPAADEIAGGQFLDLHAIEGLRIELPVESFERFVLREAGFPDAARIGLRAQQQIEKLKMRKTFLLGSGESSSIDAGSSGIPSAVLPGRGGRQQTHSQFIARS
jgi:hypothetical protein